MADQIKNTCTVCGKQRVAVSTEEEIINGSKIITTNFACPDPECQKKTDDKLEHERVEREKMKTRNEKAKTAREDSKARNAD